MNSVLGHTEPDPVGEYLGTGYQRFESPFGVSGLFKERQLGIDILAVTSRKPGTGQFKNFIEACKRSYLNIYVWEVMNPDVDLMLKRWGFKPAQDVQLGETLNGWKWPK